MSEEIELGQDETQEPQVVKLKIRYRYPWKSLVEVGDQFTISADNKSGVDNCRQLCYAATKVSDKNKEGKVFKSFKKEDGCVIIKLVGIKSYPSVGMPDEILLMQTE